MSSSVLRQRIPWNISESTPLLEEGGTEAIELGEIGGEAATLLEIEEAGAVLDSTGVGAPLGIAVGVLGALGFGAYEIYKHYFKKNPTITHAQVEQHYKEAIKNKEIHELRAQELSRHLESKRRGLVPPPFKYLGPGNSIDRGKPYNEIDDDARTHDIEYTKAKEHNQILKSDEDFLRRAGDHIADGLSGKGTVSDTFGAVLGGIGIGGKHLFEKSLGTVYYPSLSGKTCVQKSHINIMNNGLTLYLRSLKFRFVIMKNLIIYLNPKNLLYLQHR